MPIANGIIRFNKRVINPLTIKLAGRGPMVDLEHVGRRSGTVYHTPLMAFRQGETVTIALTYGPEVQWLKNVRSTGRCRMHIGGEVLTLGPPRTVEPAAGRSRIPQPQRTLLRWPIRCRDYVELLVVASARATSTDSG